MKKFLALLLILSVCSLCFLVSCRDKTDDEKDPNDENSGEVEDGGNDIIPDISVEDDDLLNEDNIDPNGWTKVD